MTIPAMPTPDQFQDQPQVASLHPRTGSGPGIGSLLVFLLIYLPTIAFVWSRLYNYAIAEPFGLSRVTFLGVLTGIMFVVSLLIPLAGRGVQSSFRFLFQVLMLWIVLAMVLSARYIIER